MKKGILALKDLVEHRKILIHGFQDKSQPWNVGNEFICIQIVDMFSEFLSQEIQYLEKVIKYLETPPKCKHPEKYHDKCADVWYCMNCNSNL